MGRSGGKVRRTAEIDYLKQTIVLVDGWRTGIGKSRPRRRARRGGSAQTKKEGPEARRKTSCGLPHAGDSVGGPDLRPRQRRGFGEESPPKQLGKSPNRDQAART